jgi:hypothetical protein
MYHARSGSKWPVRIHTATAARDAEASDREAGVGRIGETIVPEVVHATCRSGTTSAKRPKTIRFALDRPHGVVRARLQSAEGDVMVTVYDVGANHLGQASCAGKLIDSGVGMRFRCLAEDDDIRGEVHWDDPWLHVILVRGTVGSTQWRETADVEVTDIEWGCASSVKFIPAGLADWGDRGYTQKPWDPPIHFIMPIYDVAQ